MGLKEKMKGRWVPIAGGVAGLLLLLFGGVFTKGDGGTETGIREREVGFYTDTLEKKIENLVTSVSGITEAKVLLTLDCSTEYIYAQNTTQSAGGTGYSADYVLLNGGEDGGAVLLMEIYPKIRGIAVVCTDGDSVTTRQTVVELLSAALGVSANRIKVAGG